MGLFKTSFRVQLADSRKKRFQSRLFLEEVKPCFINNKYMNPKSFPRTESGSGALHNNIFRSFNDISRQVLQYANLGIPRIEFLKKTSGMLLSFSGCDALEIMAQDSRLFYRWRFADDSEGSYSFEILDGSGTADLLSPPEIISPSDNVEFNTKTAYGSILRVPFVIDEKNKGVLLLKSSRKNHFEPDAPEFFGGLAQALGIAVANRRAQAALRERIKELTCLYGISQMAGRPGIETDEIIQGIVEVLPASMQYPEISSGRIILDGEIFTTRNFFDEGMKLSSEIVFEEVKRGSIEIFYSGTAKMGENPPEFLKEEQALLNAVAAQIVFILQRKQADEEKVKLHEQLRHADRLATIGQLAAGVAHELNEPLASILGFAQLAKKCPEIPQQAGEDIDKVITASLHAREIVKKLLLFARQMPTRKTTFNINTVIKEVVSFLEIKLRKGKIKLVCSLDKNLPEITADQAQLTQVFVNLIVNAIQAMPGEGILTITTEYNEGWITALVEDTGIGMTDEVKKQIFVPFFTTKQVGKGTGLGLSVVHGILASHGGSISFESEPGEGTRFTVRLQLEDCEVL
jgi:signal transduction histidine kinase